MTKERKNELILLFNQGFTYWNNPGLYRKSVPGNKKIGKYL